VRERVAVVGEEIIFACWEAHLAEEHLHLSPGQLGLAQRHDPLGLAEAGGLRLVSRDALAAIVVLPAVHHDRGVPYGLYADLAAVPAHGVVHVQEHLAIAAVRV